MSRSCVGPELVFEGDVVVIDNLPAHASKAYARLSRHGVLLSVYLPPYSPDLNPIEMVFAKLKALLRKAAERTTDALWNRIGQLLEAFTPQECANCLAHAGYAP